MLGDRPGPGLHLSLSPGHLLLLDGQVPVEGEEQHLLLL